MNMMRVLCAMTAHVFEKCRHHAAPKYRNLTVREFQDLVDVSWERFQRYIPIVECHYPQIAQESGGETGTFEEYIERNTFEAFMERCDRWNNVFTAEVGYEDTRLIGPLHVRPFPARLQHWAWWLAVRWCETRHFRAQKRSWWEQCPVAEIHFQPQESLDSIFLAELGDQLKWERFQLALN